MADQVKFRIVIEGGPEVRAQVQKVFDDIKRASKGKIDLGIDEKAFSGLQRATQGIRAGWASMVAPIQQSHAAVVRVREATNGVGVAVGNSITHIRNMALTFGVATAAVVGLVRSAIRLSDTLQQEAAAAGLSTEKYSQFRYALQQSEGPMDNASVMLARFNKAMAQSADGTGKGAEIFKDLGLQVRDASGEMKGTLDMLGEVADRLKALYGAGTGTVTVIKTLGDAADGSVRGFEKFNSNLKATPYLAKDSAVALRQVPESLGKVADGAHYAKMAMDLFGRGGAKMTKLLLEGSEGMRRLYDEAVKLGIALSQTDSDALDDFRDNIQSTQLMLMNFINRGFAGIAPAFAKYADDVRSYLAANKEDIDKFIGGVMQSVLNSIPGILHSIKEIGLTLYALGGYVKEAISLLSPLLDIFNKITGLNVSGWAAVTVVALLYLSKAFGILKAIMLAVAANLRFLVASPIGRLMALGIVVASLIKAMSGGWGAFKTAVVDAVHGAVIAVQEFWNHLLIEFPALGALNDAVNTVFTAIYENIDGAMEGIKTAFLKAHEAIDGLVQKFNDLTGLNLSTSMVEMGAAILLLLNPIGTVKLAIAGLRGAMMLLVSTIGGWPVMIATAVGAAYLAFTNFPDLAASIKGYLDSTVQYILANLPQLMTGITDIVVAVGTALTEVVAGLLPAISEFLKGAINEISTSKEGFVGAVKELAIPLAEAIILLVGLVTLAIGDLVLEAIILLGKTVIVLLYKFFAELIPLVLESLGVFVVILLAGIGMGVIYGLAALADLVLEGLDLLLGLFGTSTTEIGQFFKDMWNGIVGGLDWAWTKMKEFGNWLKSFFVKIEDTTDKIKEATSSAQDAQQSVGSQDNPGYRQGGRISGPGTGTSDSIPIWASDGEFMVRARAVSKYGVGLLHQINSLRFADGGLIGEGVTLPAFKLPTAGSTPTRQAARTLNLYLDGQRFEGLTAPDSVANDLEKYAAKKRMSSAGKRPKWVGA